MAAALFTGPLLRRLAQYAVAGTAGNLIVKGAERARPYAGPVARRAVVTVVAGGIVGGRKLGEAAEEARLHAGDVLAEARASLGETAPAPGTAATPGQPATAASPSEPAPQPTPIRATTNNAKTAATRKAAPARKAAPRKRQNDDHGHDH